MNMQKNVDAGGEKRDFGGRRGLMISFFMFVMTIFLAFSPGAQASQEGVQWPEQWVVFAPLARNYQVVDPAQLKSIPERLDIPEKGPLPALTLDAQHVKTEPGKPFDMAGILGEDRAGLTAYVFIKLQSPDEREITLGLGADWWLQCWLNGEPFFDTLESGNDGFPPSVLNQQVDVKLREGENILAIRFSRGAASALIAVGDETHFDAARKKAEERLDKRALNILPETLSERLIFPEEEQAVISAGWTIDLSLPDADLKAGDLVGLQPMPERQIYLEAPDDRRPELRDTLEPRFDDPVTILLSKSLYPYEDRHIDAIVWTTPPENGDLSGHLVLQLAEEDGTILARHTIDELSDSGWFFSLGFPPQLAGNGATLQAIWRDVDDEIGRAEARFEVEAPSGVAQTGRIPLHVLNEPGASLQNAPMTVGVPFPRGALLTEERVRLVDDTGAEVPLQTRVSARWSRFGSIKWLLCDFTADLAGESREFYLEFGPDIQRVKQPEIEISKTGAGFPKIEAGRLKVNDNGMAFDMKNDGHHQHVLGPDALYGAFVQHEDAHLFTIPADIEHTVEERGSEKAVVRRTGWYVDENTGERFCQFVTRFVFHRESPVVRIFHTWIFTGDGNRDRIKDMGWRFGTAEAPTDGGFLASHEENTWIESSNLVQHDYKAFNTGSPETNEEGRTPGVLSAMVGQQHILFGAKDFWQNFPSELEINDEGFSFYNWPRHNPPASFERPVTRKNAFLHRFAHEGEALDFRLPDEYTEGRIWQEACSRERHWAEGNPETANAQGIARTEEMFLYFAGADSGRDEAARVMKGLNDESLRAVADPAWVAGSGVFGDIHHLDEERYPEDEHIYEQVVQAPARWNERLGFYGMWIHGDVPAWNINLHDRSVSLYRTMRKNHHGWPVAWIPFARSGDPRHLKFAEAATRQMIDANFCHYASQEVDDAVGPDYFRRQGWWDRSLLQWAARRGPRLRSYTVDCDYIWHHYYLTGYSRARDIALLFGKLTQFDYGSPRGPRTTSSMLPSYLDMYQATFDPWFLQAAHVIADLHLNIYPQEEQIGKFTHSSPGHFWRPADEAFHRFTGSEDYRLLALNHSIGYASPRSYPFGGLWSRLSVPYISQAVYAWQLTGDTFYLDRADAYLDWARRGVYDGELEYGRGSIVQGGTARGIFTGYYIRQFPLALGAFERAGYSPNTIPNPFYVAGRRVEDDQEDTYHFQLPDVIVRKADGETIDLSLAARHRDEDQPYDYKIFDPEGNEYLGGSWMLDFRPRTVDIEADAPAGDYRVQLSGRVPLWGEYSDRSRTMRRNGDIFLPLTRRSISEVMAFERTPNGTHVASGGPGIQYWFKVPDNRSEFWIEFPSTRGDFSRFSVWNPDGERVWDASVSGSAPGRVDIEVPVRHAGKLWRASGGAFTIDPAIPPYFSINAVQWFNPEE